MAKGSENQRYAHLGVLKDSTKANAVNLSWVLKHMENAALQRGWMDKRWNRWRFEIG